MDEAAKKIKRHEKMRLETDGFLANPSKAIWENIQAIIGESIINKPSNMACHDLTTNTTMKAPKQARNLLGLGLNFAIKTTAPTNNIKTTINKFQNDICHRYFITNKMDDIIDNRNFNCKLYKKSKWIPPAASKQVKECIANFMQDLQETASKYKQEQNARILSMQQEKLLSQLRQDQNLIITPADKNLSPVLLTVDQYITAAIDKHLGNKNIYQRLTIAQYQNATGYAIDGTIHQWYQEHQSNLEDSKLIFCVVAV